MNRRDAIKSSLLGMAALPFGGNLAGKTLPIAIPQLTPAAVIPLIEVIGERQNRYGWYMTRMIFARPILNKRDKSLRKEISNLSYRLLNEMGMKASPNRWHPYESLIWRIEDAMNFGDAFVRSQSLSVAECGSQYDPDRDRIFRIEDQNGNLLEYQCGNAPDYTNIQSWSDGKFVSVADQKGLVHYAPNAIFHLKNLTAWANENEDSAINHYPYGISIHEPIRRKMADLVSQRSIESFREAMHEQIPKLMDFLGINKQHDCGTIY